MTFMRLSTYNSSPNPAGILADVPGPVGGASPSVHAEKRDDLFMAGTIRCAKCAKPRTDYICPNCGARKCYFKLYWKGKDYQYRTDQHGVHMGFYEAERFSTVIRSKIDAHINGKDTFDPLEYLNAKSLQLQFSQIVDNWILEKKYEVERGELAIGTYKTYLSHRRTWWKFFDEKDIRDIGAKDLKWLRDKIEGKIKTKRCVLNNLHGFLKWAYREEIIKYVPPFPAIRGNDSTARKAISIESQNAALYKIPDRHRDIFSFAFETGIRKGELAALKVKDLSSLCDSIIIQRTYSAGNVLHETTKGKTRLEIPLSKTAQEIALRNSSGKFPEAWLFINTSTGKGYLPQTIYKIWNSAKIGVTFHEAGRHSFCTQIAKSGATIEQARRLMRHSDIRTTTRYTHLNTSDLVDIVNNREKVVQFDSSLKSKDIGEKTNENK